MKNYDVVYFVASINDHLFANGIFCFPVSIKNIYSSTFSIISFMQPSTHSYESKYFIISCFFIFRLWSFCYCSCSYFAFCI